MSGTDLVRIRELINSCEDQFNQVLITDKINFHREAGFAFEIISKNKRLAAVAENDPTSFKVAIRNVAAVGLTLNTAKKLAYLTSRYIDGKTRVCLDISYQGLIQMAYASGSITYICTEILRKNDYFKYNGPNKEPEHECDPRYPNKRGDIDGVYCMVKMKSGEILTTVLSMEEVYKSRDKSESWKNEKARVYSPWHPNNFLEDMIKKTAVRKSEKYWDKTDRSNHLVTALEILNQTDGIVFSGDKNEVKSDLIEAAYDLIPPPPEQEVGPEYTIYNGIYKDKKLCQIPMIDLEDYKEKLESRKNPKTWQLELVNVLNSYIDMGGHDETEVVEHFSNSDVEF